MGSDPEVLHGVSPEMSGNTKVAPIHHACSFYAKCSANRGEASGSDPIVFYCFLLFSIVLLRPIFEPVHDDVVGRTPGEVPPPLAHRNFRRNRKRSALRGLKLSASHFKTALW